jgi:major histocompatibility complex class I
VVIGEIVGKKYSSQINSLFLFILKIIPPGVVVHTFNPSTWEAEAGESLSSRPAWSTK